MTGDEMRPGASPNVEPSGITTQAEARRVVDSLDDMSDEEADAAITADRVLGGDE